MSHELWKFFVSGGVTALVLLVIWFFAELKGHN